MRQGALKLVKDPLLRSLIPGSGSVSQARNELRWLKKELGNSGKDIRRAVYLRGQLRYPLQYILKSQPFGELEIACEAGVLIPRWETEEWTQQLAKLYMTSIGPTGSTNLRVLDLGTGTGCILFLLKSLIPNITGIGLDVSPYAIQLFERNLKKLQMSQLKVAEHSIFNSLPLEYRQVDLVVSNPPYISKLNDADYSVRKYEPELALVEPPHIYEQLVSRVLETDATRAVFEVGNKAQIDLCRELFENQKWHTWGQVDSAGQWRTIWAENRR